MRSRDQVSCIGCESHPLSLLSFPLPTCTSPLFPPSVSPLPPSSLLSFPPPYFSPLSSITLTSPSILLSHTGGSHLCCSRPSSLWQRLLPKCPPHPRFPRLLPHLRDSSHSSICTEVWESDHLPLQILYFLSDTAATIFLLHVLVWLLFKGSISFFGKPQTSMMT